MIFWETLDPQAFLRRAQFTFGDTTNAGRLAGMRKNVSSGSQSSCRRSFSVALQGRIHGGWILLAGVSTQLLWPRMGLSLPGVTSLPVHLIFLLFAYIEKS